MACVNLNFDVNVNDCLRGLWALLRLSWPKSGIEKLRKEMTLLKSKRDDIKAEIDQAEREGRIPTSQVSQWLRDVETLEGQVDAIENDFQNISCFSCHCFKQTQTGGTTSQTQQAGDQTLIRESSNYCSIVRRVAKKLGEPNELMSRVLASDSIATTPPPEHAVMEDISHRQLIGIKSYVDDIVGYINGGKDNIGIYGMGGVGKTTVLKSIRRHYLLNHTIFDCVIWVVASKDCPLKRLQMDIAKCLKLQTLDENDDEQTCGEKLFIYLKNRNCLLLLDDIWKHLDRKLLGMAHPITEQGQQQPRKIVVFTTRSETVCYQMKAKKKIKVNCLDSVQAWQLFEENSDGDVLSSYAGIKFVAEDLVKECGGLPLALIIVARAMSGKKSLDLWKDALHQMKYKHAWVTTKLSEEDSVDMYNAFKLSYDNLENDSIKECFLCCALWPEDFQISIFYGLIPCWIGCGIISEFDVINEAFTKGDSHLEALIAASLLEPVRVHDYYKEEYVKMHDVIRDMALLMVSGLKGDKRKWIVNAGIGLTRLPVQKDWQEAERASFMKNKKITSLQDYEASTFSKLSMLILTYNNGLTTIPSSLFTSMPHLTYLDLSHCYITELPIEIDCLIELRYLDLSSTRIRRLPLEFGRLNKLEYLLLRNAYELEIVPNEIISNLSMLKWLDIMGNSRGSALWLNELEYSTGHHQISLGIDISSANFKRLSMLTNVSVWRLKVCGSQSSKFPEYDLGTLQWSRVVSDNLEFLEISNVSGDKLMMNKGEDCEYSSFTYLKCLYFLSLGQLKDIRLNGVEFNNLRDLCIWCCPKLKDVSWVLQLPCLNLLEMSKCEEMEELISNVGNSNSRFGIKMLILNEMENLHSIAQHPLHFPCLDYIKVVRCPRLKKLPFRVEILENRFRMIEGQEYWWNNLAWDDESIKDFLTRYFRLSNWHGFLYSYCR